MSGAALDFRADVHEYRLGGVLVPSVTQVLRATGVSVDFEGLRETSDRLRDAIDLKRDLGVACHADAHAYDDDDLDWSTVDPRVEPYLRAWAVFRANTSLAPCARERRLYHPVHRYAGTLDGIFRLPSGRQVLVDMKLGDPESAASHLQTAAYEAAYLVEHPDAEIHERWAVQLCPERQVPYRVTNYTDRPEAWQDLHTFLCCLTVYHEQPARRRQRVA